MANGQLATVVRQIHQFAGNADPREGTDGQLLERFLTGGEESAFAALVRRHGPMVLGVCRRVLRDRHAAEDAFQAAFLVLLRRARSLDKRGSVAGWLYTVAYHVALRARAEAARRRQRERPALRPPEGEPTAGSGWADLQPALDEELERLPETYRAVVVLCYLEGKTNAEAARLLGWPVGSVKGRLARARELLRTRLTRRGITLAGGLLGAALAGPAMAAVREPLVHTTLHTALPRAAAAAGGGAASPAAVALAEGALRTMFVTKPRAVVALFVLVGLAALGVGAATQPAQAQRQGAVQLKVRRTGEVMPKPLRGGSAVPAAKKGAAEDPEMTLAGRVLGADGKALSGARVAVLGWRPGRAAEKPQLLAKARTDREGKFSLRVRRPSPLYALVALASAPGHALGWHGQFPDPKAEIRLPPEEVLRGRLIDLQGQPAAGVKLDVVRLGPRGGINVNHYILTTDLDGDEDEDVMISRPAHLRVTRTDRVALWDLDMAVDRSDGMEAGKAVRRGLALPEPPEDVPAWPGPVTTDANGRFELRGVPRGLGAALRVRDPRFALQLLGVPAPQKGKPAEITRVLNPPRVLEGTVTDAASGKPVPHARVKVHAPGDRGVYRLVTSVRFAYAGALGGADLKGRQGMGANDLVSAAFVEIGNFLLPDDGGLPPLEVPADANGRFRINLFHADTYTLRVTAPRGEPYLARTVTVRWPQGAVVRKQQDVGLVRGIPVRGRVTEAPGGKAVAEARVDFWSRGLKLPEGVRHPRPVRTGPDGSFRALLPAGSWHLLVNGPQAVFLSQPIPVGKLVEAAAADGKGDKPRPSEPGRPTRFYPDAWKALDLKAGEGPREVSFTLRRAPLLRGRVVGPDGKPATGVLLLRRPAVATEATTDARASVHRVWLDVFGTVPAASDLVVDLDGWDAGGPPSPVELRDGDFSIPVLDPNATLPLLFLDPARDLGAFVKVEGKRAGGEPVTVRLEPCGTARARFVDDKGKPLTGHRPQLMLLLPPGPESLPGAAARAAPGIHWIGADRLDPRRYQKGPLTDADGRVTLPGLIPGASYELLLGGGKGRTFRVRSGETLDLGELTGVIPPPAAPVRVGEPRKR